MTTVLRVWRRSHHVPLSGILEVFASLSQGLDLLLKALPGAPKLLLQGGEAALQFRHPVLKGFDLLLL